jgi:hypothetical protein
MAPAVHRMVMAVGVLAEQIVVLVSGFVFHFGDELE